MYRRDFLAFGGFVGFGLPTFLPTETKQLVKVYECTFLKSFDQQPDKLIRFLTENWFAMDKIAVEQGLIVNYSLFESPDDAEGWNVLVLVGYPSQTGYQAITQEFEKIRHKHQKVLIDGKDLKDLGKIVGSRKIYPRVRSDA